MPAYPDRAKIFPSSKAEFINPLELPAVNDGEWRHELEHDAASVFWLLLYWAMVLQPEKCHKEKVHAVSWGALNGNYELREDLMRTLQQSKSSYFTHSFYNPLLPLIKALATFLIIDSHWLPDSDSRKDPSYITEAFQRLILQFIIDNRGKEFMDHRVEKTFHLVRGVQASKGWSSTLLQSLDAEKQGRVNSVGCVCGTMNSSPFLLLCLQGADDVEMDDP